MIWLHMRWLHSWGDGRCSQIRGTLDLDTKKDMIVVNVIFETSFFAAEGIRWLDNLGWDISCWWCLINKFFGPLAEQRASSNQPQNLEWRPRWQTSWCCWCQTAQWGSLENSWLLMSSWRRDYSFIYLLWYLWHLSYAILDKYLYLILS